jgi:hypothetical protein
MEVGLQTGDDAESFSAATVEWGRAIAFPSLPAGRHAGVREFAAKQARLPQR